MSAASMSTSLTGPQLKALSALLAGGSTAEAAQALRVSQRTLRDWLQQPAFRAAFLQGQPQLFHQISMQLAGAATRALHTLLELSENPEQKGSVRMAAANKVLPLFLHHGPRISTLLAPPETSKAPDTDTPLFDRLMADLEKVYGSDDDEAELAPVKAPPPPAAGVPSSPPAVPPASASPGGPAPAPAAEPLDVTPTPGLSPSPFADPAPRRLTFASRSAAETPPTYIEPGQDFVSWRH